MAIKRYTANADTTITNAYKFNLQTRATASNMGQADILETFYIYAQASSASSELERILVKFPATGTLTGTIAHDRNLDTIPESGSVSFYLRLFNARQSETTPKDFKLLVHAVTTEWNEGLGLDMVNYTDTDAASWKYANNTKVAQVATASFSSATPSDYGGKYISFYDSSRNRYNFWFNDGDDEAPTLPGEEIEVDISGDSNAADVADTFKTVADARDEFGATRATAVVTVTNATAGTVDVLYAPTTDSGDITTGVNTTGSNSTPWTSTGGDFDNGVGGIKNTFTASFDTGFEDIELDITPLVEQWIDSPGNVLGSKSNYGMLIRMSSSLEDGTESYYTKKFFARGSQFFFKRPVIEARWDSSKKDDRGAFYYSSSLAPAADNLNTLYLYNYVRGQLKNIPSVGTTGSILVSLYSGSADNSAPAGSKLKLSIGGNVAAAADLNATGGYVSTGIYSCSLAFTGSTSLTKMFDLWHSGTTDADQAVTTPEYFTGSITPVVVNSTWPGQEMNPNQNYVSKITNLRPVYSSTNKSARFRLYTRKKNWSPSIYTISSIDMPISIVDDAYYRISDAKDGETIIDYGTGSNYYTRLSYDVSGSYFDLDMSLLESDKTYEIKFVYYLNGQYAEQEQSFKFRVE